jgi:hypothetical protein
MSDIIERAEAALAEWTLAREENRDQGQVINYLQPHVVVEVVEPLVAELKARNNASELSEDVIAHVLADIDQVNDEDSWSLRQRLEVIQKICDGSEYNIVSDIIERAEAAIDTYVLWKMDVLVKDLVAELKAARAENERLRVGIECLNRRLHVRFGQLEAARAANERLRNADLVCQPTWADGVDDDD